LSVTGDTILAGNLTVSGTTEYNNVTNLAIQDPIITLGRGANNTPLASTSTTDRGEQLYYYASGVERSAFVGYQVSTGNLIAATRATVTNEVVTVSEYGNFVVGTLAGTAVNVTGNVFAGNLSLTGNVISALNITGNVTGGNINSAGVVSSTGNVTGGNITTTGNITGGNLIGTHVGNLTGTTVSVTGNVTGLNLNGTGLNVSGNTAVVTSAGYQIGYRDLPQITSFTTLVADAGGKHYYGSGTILIPASGTLNFAIGTAILVIASGATSINAAGGVTLIQAGTGTGGNRTLAQYGEATLVKVASDTWYISGVGIS
jgi:hypothetical protein